ncbi:hypothetical protein AMTR_s00089p00175890 [Amborella trichopoda]|uniref:Uncharacterized protein n=1 Tax=Amborella trichopoda TaxID=13333 RepID=W1P1W8_AMBTC|nr:hypothetical protein AMTR_s00089p00175890 [Amborella trichopoda]
MVKDPNPNFDENFFENLNPFIFAVVRDTCVTNLWHSKTFAFKDLCSTGKSSKVAMDTSNIIEQKCEGSSNLYYFSVLKDNDMIDSLAEKKKAETFFSIRMLLPTHNLLHLEFAP